MVPVTTPARLLESLPPRPPTPPRDSSDGSPSAAVLEDCSNRASMGSSDSARRFMMDTPPNDAPSSSAGTSGSTAGKARKRVEWSPWTNYYKAPVSDSARRHTTDGQLKVLPPSRERTCSKSILKPYDRFIPVVPSYPSNQPANTLSAHSYADFPAMLESVLQQLAGEARSARVDAYLLLSGALKYYDDIPDPRAIGEKMGLFMQFIRRDLNAETPGQTVLDTNLITQALKVLSIFIWTPQICESLADDFMVFVLDQAVTVLEKPSVPKVLVNNYMHLLGQQKFGPKIMSPERANRIITSLSRLDGHVKGNSILGERLVVYQRLLSQAKNVMAARAESWMDHLWSALQSGIREIRSRAISFGIQAGIELGATGHVTRVFEECFDRRHGQGTFAAHIQRHLAAMVAAKEEGSHAAQIWSVAILFLRSPPYQLEHWVHMKPWLLVIQKCFNSSDVMTKFQANTAWNRLIFAVGPDASTGQMMIKMLRQPMLGHMERKVVDKNSRTARQMALSSLCCLLYYAFRPSADFKQLSLYWDEYVAQVLGKSVLHSPADVDYGCAILACLFDASQSKPWNENRANEDGALQPEELPRLDPKWARANAQTICKTVETALSKANWSRTGDSETPVRKLWRTFMKAISDAATKEVKVSREHMEAMAQIMSLLGRIWRAGPIALSLDPEAADADADADFLDRFGFLVRTSVDALGGRCFTEKFLPRNGEDLSEALVTPTHSSPRTKSEKLHSPMLRLLHLFSEPPRDTLLTAPLFDMVRAMLESCCNAWGSSRTQMALLRECAEVLSPVTDNFPPSRGLYQIVAELASKAMELIVSDSARPTSELATHEFHDAVVILGQRCGLVYTELSNTWQALISTTIRASKILLGDDGIVDAVIQPLASMLSLQEFVDGENGILSNAACILSLAPFPDDEIIRDRPRRAPWGTASSLRKDRPNQFNFLHLMIDSILMSSYRDFSRLDKADLGLFLSALSHYITRCPPSKIGRLLGLVQLGVSSWVEDADHKLTAKDQSIWDVFVTVMNLWAAIATAVERLPSKDSATLEELEVLITSGLQSRRRVIVNRSIELWNSTFGAEEALEYPAKVRHAILPFKGLDSLLLPTFPVEADDEVADEGHSFVDASDGESGGAGINTFSSPAGVPATGLAAWADPVRLTASSPARRSLVKPHSPTRPNPRRNAKRKARAGKQKPRLRHDDSQIQFAPIESSPIHSSAADSQDLTDHQREVRQKQRAQAENMFPDLRSSPHRRSKGAKATLPQLLLSSDLPSTGAFVVDGATTPTLPPPARGPMDFFIASSPTPQRGSNRAAGPEGGSILPAASPGADAPASSPPRGLSPAGRKPPILSASRADEQTAGQDLLQGPQVSTTASGDEVVESNASATGNASFPHSAATNELGPDPATCLDVRSMAGEPFDEDMEIDAPSTPATSSQDGDTRRDSSHNALRSSMRLRTRSGRVPSPRRVAKQAAGPTDSTRSGEPVATRGRRGRPRTSMSNPSAEAVTVQERANTEERVPPRPISQSVSPSPGPSLPESQAPGDSRKRKRPASTVRKSGKRAKAQPALKEAGESEVLDFIVVHCADEPESPAMIPAAPLSPPPVRSPSPRPVASPSSRPLASPSPPPAAAPSPGAVASPSPPPAELSAPAAPPATTTVTATATATATATVTGSSILAALSKVLRDIRQVAFGGLARQEVRAIDDVMFDIRREAFQADTGGE